MVSIGINIGEFDPAQLRQADGEDARTSRPSRHRSTFRSAFPARTFRISDDVGMEKILHPRSAGTATPPERGSGRTSAAPSIASKSAILTVRVTADIRQWTTGYAAVSDKNRSSVGRFLGLARVLVKFPTA